jgi:hypothetical protein
MSSTLSKDLLARIAAKVAAIAPSPSPVSLASPSPSPPAHGPYHQAAAVLSSFDPGTLRPLGFAPGSGTPPDAGEVLADSVELREPGGSALRTLTPAVRIAVLRQLRAEKRLGEALAANPRRPDDPVQRALEAYLLGPAPPLDRQTLPQLAAAYQVIDWLRAAGFEHLPERAEISQRVDWLALLQPFEHLAGDHFRGRAAELDRLRAYAGVMPPGSALSRLTLAASTETRIPLLVYGPGGVGKSTLLARFILEHARAQRQDRFPFAYLDFDRPDVAAEEPLTLLVEAVRQLGIAYPRARESCDRIRRGWLDLISQRHASPAAGLARQQTGSARVDAAAIQDFRSLIGSLGAQDRPLLLVLDTFEEVQYRSRSYVAAIWRLLDGLWQAVPRLRVVIAGRGEVPEHETDPLHLSGLDEEAAIGYLQARGVADPALARALAKQVGGSPLSLKLASELVQREGVDAGGQLDIATREFFFLRIDDAIIQRQLYRRILGHIHDEDVRRLAHPGLVLRRITPALILEVLAAPCALAISSLAEAAELFAKLRREVSLVTVDPDGALRHRQDVRMLMLRLLQADEAEKTRSIHARAVAFYERQPAAPIERAEEIYHRLWLDQPAATIDPRWLPGIEPHLARAMEELSGARKAYLASRLGADIDEATRNLADLEDWEQIASREARVLLNRQRPQDVLDLFAARRERSLRSPLVALEAEALAQLRRWPEGLQVLEQGFERVAGQGDRQPALALALQAAQIALAGRQVDAAPALGSRLGSLAGGSLAVLDRWAVVTRRLALARLAAAREDAACFERELGELLDRLPDEEIAAHPPLGHWSAGLLAAGDVSRLSRLLRLAGLPTTTPAAVRRLAAEITAFDIESSKGTGQAPGMLAKRLGVGVGVGGSGSLIAAWTEFLLNAPEPAIREALWRMLDEYSAFLPPTLLAAIPAMMRAAVGAEAEASAVDAEESAPTQRKGPPSARLSAAVRSALIDALAGAFSPDELDEFLRLRLDRSLTAIAALSESPREQVFRVVEAADAEGWALALVARACEARPADNRLAEVARQLGLLTLAAASVPLAFPVGQLLDPAAWRARLGEIEGQVCRVEAGRSSCTGFLVGFDLLLTADVALDPVLGGKVPASAVKVRFDIRADRRGRQVSGGTAFELESDWLVARSAYGAAPDQLGYLIARIKDTPGAQPIGGSVAESSAVLRRWIEMPPQPQTLAPGAGLALVQQAEGAPIRLALNQKAVVGQSADGCRLYYDLETRPGASGSPCFSSNLEPVALHLGTAGAAGADPAAPRGSKVGVLLSAVIRDLDRQGFTGLLKAHFA